MNVPGIDIGIAYLKRNDPVIKSLIENTGECRLAKSNDYFRDLIRNIISQQLSVSAASTILKRFVDLVGKITPENICKYSVKEFRKTGVSEAKSKYILELSNRIINGSFTFENIELLNDEEAVSKLTSIKGVGIWTAQMFLIFSINRLNVLPLDDVGFQRAVCRFYRIEKHEFKNKISKISSNWGDYKTIAVWYLWEGLDGKQEL